MKQVIFITFVSLFLFEGCTTLATGFRHSPDEKNTISLEKLKYEYYVRNISSPNEEISSQLTEKKLPCRLYYFDIADKNTVSAYYKQTLESEFQAAKKLNPQGRPIDIKINIMTPSFSGLTSGSWLLEVEYAVNNKTYRISSITPFDTSISSYYTCFAAGVAFEKTIINNFLDFSKLLE